MRSIIILISLLGGCAAPASRCDSHLQPINAPAGMASDATAKKPTVRSEP